MNAKITTLAIASIMGLSTMSQAFAAESGGARFNFAPNVWGSEEAHHSVRATDPVHKVREGAVPNRNMLGLDPAMLVKPVAPAPVVQTVTTVAATPITAQVSPKPVPPPAKPTFSPSFGKPTNPPVVAQAPVAPLVAQPAAMKEMSKPVINATRNVKAVLAHRPRKSDNGMMATAGKVPDSYGKDFGYVPGPYVPTSSSGSSVRTTADVHGQIIR